MGYKFIKAVDDDIDYLISCEIKANILDNDMNKIKDKVTKKINNYKIVTVEDKKVGVFLLSDDYLDGKLISTLYICNNYQNYIKLMEQILRDTLKQNKKIPLYIIVNQADDDLFLLCFDLGFTIEGIANSIYVMKNDNYIKINKVLKSLSKSKFRSSFKLKEKDILYVKEKGLDTIREHANEIINNRLAKDDIKNDGKQTPYKGHPVFIAQHATATCCRKCLAKWHYLGMEDEILSTANKMRKLETYEINYIVDLIMEYIEREVNEE